MLVFAHRGASAQAPENTLLAMHTAVQQQVDGIEIDVYQHGDEFIVLHDQRLERTTNGIGNFSDYSLTELQKLDAGQGQFIPTLCEVMQTIAGQTLLNIEVKALQSVECLLNYVNQFAPQFGFAQEQIIYSSFEHEIVRQIKALQPKSRIAALTANKPVDSAAFAQNLDAEFVNIADTAVDQAFICDAHQRGLKVMVFTVDGRQQLSQLEAWQVDGVFSNNAAQASAWLKG